MEASSLATVVSSSGHSYAMAAAASTLSSAAMISEKYGGLTQVSYYECAHVHQCYKGVFPLDFHCYMYNDVFSIEDLIFFTIL